MKVFKTLLIILSLLGIVIASISCTANSGTTATSQPQIATVQKGDISINVTGTGNLALKTKQWLSFGQTGLVSQQSTVKILEVLVTEGQVVEEGQVLVKADTTDWQDQITSLQYQVDSAKASLDQSKYNLLQGQNNLANDEERLSQQADVQLIQDKIDNANIQLQQAKLSHQAALQNDPATATFHDNMIRYLSIDTQYANAAPHQPDGGMLAIYRKQLTDLLTDPEHYLANQVNGTAASVAAIKSVQRTIEQDKASLVNLQNSIVNAQNRVDEAQRALDNEKNSSQQIIAPLKGLLTQVKVTKGDIVQRNTNLIEIADAEKFIANILVTERDVMSVKMEGSATVSFDALSGLTFPAKITQIAPLATVQQGVVNYKVTVELTSLRPVSPSAGISSSGPAAGFTPRATPSGGLSGSGAGAGSGRTSGQFTSPNLNLKDGLSATVTVPIQQKTNIILVPSRAITRQGQTSTVQVIKGTGTESRNVKTGLSDTTNTEITEGLSEGEQVMVRAATAATSTTNNRPPGGGFIIR